MGIPEAVFLALWVCYIRLAYSEYRNARVRALQRIAQGFIEPEYMKWCAQDAVDDVLRMLIAFTIICHLMGIDATKESPFIPANDHGRPA